MKKIPFLKIACASLVVLTMSCKNTDAPAEADAKPAFDMAATKTTLETAHTEWEKAFNTKDSVGLANCYAKDGKLMGPNDKSVEGRANIQKMFGQWMQGETPQIDLTLVDVWGDETSLSTESSWRMIGKDGKVVDEGKAIEIYTMEDGKWKLYRDCYNSNMPCPK